jgi:7-cyano-7-deazaguanine synthase in queuosine biosynthesis
VRYEFTCGGARPPATGRGERRALDVQGNTRNINLRITDISRALVSNIPDVLLDLLEVAAYIYCADQQTRRGSETLTDYAAGWRREMIFQIPVRTHGIWQSVDVKEALADVLSFLSDDYYKFEFVPAQGALAEKEAYFAELTDYADQPDEVALFSGGLDSFAGIVEAQAQRKRLVLVGHHASSKILNIQSALVEALNQRAGGRGLLFIPVNITNSGANPVEYTQRTRSFLFAVLGIVVARMFGKEEITFFENGVVSLNLPIAADVVGARATRTTHPRVIRGFENFFSLMLGREISVRTPFQWLTKTEVVRKISQHGAAGLLAMTNSCTRPRAMTKKHPHCGVCSQCIDRRFAVLAAGLAEVEPSELYGVDLLTGDRTHDRDVRMAAAYVKFFREFGTCPNGGLIARYPEVTAALNHFDDTPPRAAEQRIYELYMRHHQDVVKVLDRGAEEHRDLLIRGALPAGCLLSMLFNRQHLETAVASNYQEEARAFMDRLPAPGCDFAVEVGTGKIHFRGHLVLEGANSELFHALLPAFRAAKQNAEEGPFIPTGELTESLGMNEWSLRQQVGRLRKAVTEHLAVQLGLPFGQDDVIENRPGQGYRINPQLREIMLGDLGRT